MTAQEIKDKIYSEIIVDAYGDSEIAMCWYYYFTDELTFPFEAQIKMKTRSKRIYTMSVDVLGVSSAEEETLRLEVSAKGEEIVFDVSPSRLINIKASEENQEVFEVWNFWKKK